MHRQSARMQVDQYFPGICDLFLSDPRGTAALSAWTKKGSAPAHNFYGQRYATHCF